MTDDDLKWVQSRFYQRAGGDIGEVLEAIDEDGEVRKYFNSVGGPNETFVLIDQLDQLVQREHDRRFQPYEAPRVRA